MDNTGVQNEPKIPSVPLHIYYKKMHRKMEYNFPEELIVEILKRVPVESLLRFMCVSKSWHSLITSQTFISTHLSCHANANPNPSSEDSISTLFRADSRFFIHRLHEPIDAWTEVNSPMDTTSVIVGCCHGVVCLYDYFSKVLGHLILWNPSIRKAFTLPLETSASNKQQICNVNSTFPNFTFTLGFGFDLVSNEYKVVRVDHNWLEESNTTILHTNICSLNKSGWTKGGALVEDGKIIVECGGVYLNGVIHWIFMRKHGSAIISRSILTFDLANDVFGEFHLPLSVAPHSVSVLMSVKMVEDKLAVSCADSGGNVLERNYKNSGSNVWVMTEYGNQKSWTRLIDVYLGDSVGIVKGALSTRDGKIVVATSAGNWISWDFNNDMIENMALPVLEPDFMNVYVPSLVLLRCSNKALCCREIPLKKKKRSKRMTARKYRRARLHTSDTPCSSIDGSLIRSWGDVVGMIRLATQNPENYY